MIVAGIMSGTSLDGIDVAVVDLARGPRIREVIAHRSFPYPAETRERLLKISNAETHTAEVSRLNFLLPELYAKALRRSGVALDLIELIGCHGQTIYHESGRNTLQIGDGSVLAERAGIAVVSDFRPRDIAAGGRGAPLVPYVDYLLFRDRRKNRVALNLGGIGNISIIPAGAAADQVIAFDTGPGNMVIDQLITRHTAGRITYDRGGLIASKNRVDSDLLDRLLSDPYYRAKPPKTLGREQYGRQFVNDLLATGLPVEELIATATALTAATVATGIQRFAPDPADELVVAGGGVHNRAMMAYLAGFLPGVRIRTTDEFGVNADAKEAIAFAILAHETWHRRPSNLPSATGARHPVILGKISYV